MKGLCLKTAEARLERPETGSFLTVKARCLYLTHRPHEFGNDLEFLLEELYPGFELISYWIIEKGGQ